MLEKILDTKMKAIARKIINIMHKNVFTYERIDNGYECTIIPRNGYAIEFEITDENLLLISVNNHVYTIVNAYIVTRKLVINL